MSIYFEILIAGRDLDALNSIEAMLTSPAFKTEVRHISNGHADPLYDVPKRPDLLIFHMDEAHVEELQERIARLDQLQGQVPDKFIEAAKQALAEGDNNKADQLFSQVEESADPHIAAAAEVAYPLPLFLPSRCSVDRGP